MDSRVRSHDHDHGQIRYQRKDYNILGPGKVAVICLFLAMNCKVKYGGICLNTRFLVLDVVYRREESQHPVRFTRSSLALFVYYHQRITSCN